MTRNPLLDQLVVLGLLALPAAPLLAQGQDADEDSSEEAAAQADDEPPPSIRAGGSSHAGD